MKRLFFIVGVLLIFGLLTNIQLVMSQGMVISQGNPGSPSGNGIQPMWVEDNPACEDLAYCTCTESHKVDPPNSGTYTLPNGNSITVTSDGVYFDYTSTVGICCVIVKGGPNANVYQYDPLSFGDTNLHAPINPNNNQIYGISHIEFCYDPGPQRGTELRATKDAEAELARTWDWNIEKTVYPQTWDLFKGDEGISKFTVTVTKTSYTDVITVSGQIHVTNVGFIPTENLTIVDQVQYKTSSMTNWADIPGASVTLTPAQLDSGGHEDYDYSFTFDAIEGAEYRNIADVTITNWNGHMGEAYGIRTYKVFTIPTQPTSEVNGTIHVDDTNGYSWEFSDNGSVTYTKKYRCNDDAGAHQNTATIRELPDHFAQATVTVNCHALEIEKDASTSFNRYYSWTIDKSANKHKLDLKGCEEYPVYYKVIVAQTYIDNDFAVSGKIYVHNPAPIDAVINSLEDILPGATNLNVDCGITFPFTLVAGGTMTCAYSADLPDNSQRTNTAKVKLQNFSYAQVPEQPVSKEPIGETEFSAEKTFDFGEIPAEEIDECIDVSDTNLDPPSLGPVCAVDAPDTFKYHLTVGPYYASGDYVVKNTAKYVTNDTQTEGSDSWTLNIHVQCPIPMADFSAEPTSGVSPLEVHFMDLSINAARWLWDFGDGTTSTDQNPVHVFNNPPRKWYAVKLTVWDCCEEYTDVMIKENFITVHQEAFANFNAFPIVGPPELAVQFTNKCGGGVSHFLWDYGDGESEHLTHSVMDMIHPVHTYKAEGEFTISLKAWGNGGEDMLTIPNMIYVAQNYAPLELVDASAVVEARYGWDNAIDHDIITTDNSRVLAFNGDAWAIFKTEVMIQLNKVRLLANTALGTSFANHLVKDFEIWISENGVDFTLGYSGTVNNKDDWEVFEFDPVNSQYIKLVLVNARGENSPYVTLCEFQVFGEPMTNADKLASGMGNATEVNVQAPTEYGLSPNYPNPFNPETTIRFQLPEAADVVLSIYNIQGQLITTLVSAHKAAGYYDVVWNGKDRAGNEVAGGLYIYSIRINVDDSKTFSSAKKMMFMK